ncbi:MAG: Fe(2+) transporter permease subunit FeoB [Halothiobacillaceae bacterium]
MSVDRTVALVGNPNCGKTTLFNALTGARQRVGNWPGVTVERKTGRYRYEGREVEVVDLPGTYSLDVSDGEVSLDEQIVHDYIAAGEADLIINIVDASNLERNLYLTAQLIEIGTPLVIALNMMDVAADKGVQIDVDRLSAELGCPVVPVVASEGRGIPELKHLLHSLAEQPTQATTNVTYADALEHAIVAIEAELAPVAHDRGISARWLALRALAGDAQVRELLRETAGPDALSRLEDATESLDDVDILVADGRYAMANRVANAVTQRSGSITRDMTDLIDRVVLNRLLGIPIFLAVMYLMFMLTINIGGAFIDFFDILAGTLFVDGLGAALSGAGSPEWLTLVVADGIGGGIQVVATFIPIIGLLYLFLSALEDSGYMARAAFVMDRFMRWIGLPGKSFVPLIVGFGCNVPAIMATRTLEQNRDRIMTVMMSPFMCCGARLPVYALFAAAFFPIGGQNVVFGLYLIGIAVAVMTGLMLKHTMLKGEAMPYVMELPRYHRPTLKGVLIRTWERLKSFIVGAGRIIVPMVLVLNVLNAIGTDGTFGHEDSPDSVLSEIGRTLSPAFAPIGLDEENWPATVGIFTGILAKEAVVGTLDSMYTALAEAETRAQGLHVGEEEDFSLTAGVSEALGSIPANLADSLGAWGDPLGIGVGETAHTAEAAEAQGVEPGTFGAMAARFDGAAGAFAYLLFVLLYTPCVAAIAAAYRETGPGWTGFMVAWTTGVAYAGATLFYQVATFGQHPQSALAWIIGILTALVLLFLALKRWGRRNAEGATGPIRSG